MFDIKDFYFFAWPKLWEQSIETEISIEAMKMIVNNQERIWVDIKNRLDEQIENDDFGPLEEEYRASYYSQAYEIETRTLEKLRYLQRSAAFVSVFSLFEGRLKTLCQMIENDFDFKVKISDLSGRDDIQKLWSFLVKIYELRKNRIENLLHPIRQQKTIRNILVHHEGFLTEEQEKNIRQMPGLIVIGPYDSLYQIQIAGSEFIINLLEKVRLFYEELLIEIDRRYREIKDI